MKDLIKEIQILDLDNNELANNAEKLYSRLVEKLIKKYGEVDKDYDRKPTTRGAEWLDIHHIDETELVNIASQTDKAKKEGDHVLLWELIKYNMKDRLVYANKIEHFLLHYLIDCIRGAAVFSGGPNLIWDNAIALEYFELKSPHLIKLQNRDDLYDDISLVELTKLYKKLIDWKGWEISRIKKHWVTINSCPKRDEKRFYQEIRAVLDQPSRKK